MSNDVRFTPDSDGKSGHSPSAKGCPLRAMCGRLRVGTRHLARAVTEVLTGIDAPMPVLELVDQSRSACAGQEVQAKPAPHEKGAHLMGASGFEFGGEVRGGCPTTEKTSQNISENISNEDSENYAEILAGRVPTVEIDSNKSKIVLQAVPGSGEWKWAYFLSNCYEPLTIENKLRGLIPGD